MGLNIISGVDSPLCSPHVIVLKILDRLGLNRWKVSTVHIQVIRRDVELLDSFPVVVWVGNSVTWRQHCNSGVTESPDCHQNPYFLLCICRLRPYILGWHQHKVLRVGYQSALWQERYVELKLVGRTLADGVDAGKVEITLAVYALEASHYWRNRLRTRITGNLLVTHHFHKEVVLVELVPSKLNFSSINYHFFLLYLRQNLVDIAKHLRFSSLQDARSLLREGECLQTYLCLWVPSYVYRGEEEATKLTSSSLERCMW